MMSLKKQQGMVIVVALFIMALCATMAYVMVARLARDTHRTTLIQRAAEANSVADGSVLWAKEKLKTDWEKQVANQPIDALPIHSPKDEENGFIIETTIVDMQSHYNLNSLTPKTEDTHYFKRLLQLTNTGLTDENAAAIVMATVHWLSPTNKTALDRYYQALPHPYQAGHRPFAMVSEWKKVKGVTPAIYKNSAPYLTALPDATKINVASASYLLLAAFSEEVTPDTAQAIVTQRQAKPFLKLEDFTQLDTVKNHSITPNNIVVVSDYFLVTTTITFGDQTVVLYSLLKRVTNGKKADVMLIAQTKGVW